jgi:hypothetical protein
MEGHPNANETIKISKIAWRIRFNSSFLRWDFPETVTSYTCPKKQDLSIHKLNDEDNKAHKKGTFRCAEHTMF